MSKEIAVTNPRNSVPTNLADYGLDQRKWRVLVEATFPNAQTTAAILMAVDYCKARGLDVFKKPVHIVPMWNSSLGKEVETVWPGINEVQITAARTKEWAGMDKPSWGPTVTRKFTGSKKVKDFNTGNYSWEKKEIELTFPEWCEVTVYRLIGGSPRAFSEPVYWMEAYSRCSSKSDLPTDMWIKRVHGQLQKVAKAASLRAAFPEEGEYVAEEMEGKEIESGGVVIDHSTVLPEEPIKQPPHQEQAAPVVNPTPHQIIVPLTEDAKAADWAAWATEFKAGIVSSKTLADLEQWVRLNAIATGSLANNSENLHGIVTSIIVKMRTKLTAEDVANRAAAAKAATPNTDMPPIPTALRRDKADAVEEAIDQPA